MSCTSLPSANSATASSSVARTSPTLPPSPSSASAIVAALPGSPPDAQRLHGLGHVVHAHDVGAGKHRQHIAGNRAAEALVRLRRRHEVDEALARQPRSAAAGRTRCNSANRAIIVMLCSGVLPKPIPGSSTMRSRAMPARAAMSSERAKKAFTSAMMSMRRIGASRLCMTITGTPCSATTRAMSGSRCRPHTSLTIAAPCSSAQAATLALMVSIETGRPSAIDRRAGPVRGAPAPPRARPAPHRHRAASNSAPTSRMSAPSAAMRRACAIARPRVDEAPAVGKRVRRDVENAHHERAAAREQPVKRVVVSRWNSSASLRRFAAAARAEATP